MEPGYYKKKHDVRASYRPTVLWKLFGGKKTLYFLLQPENSAKEHISPTRVKKNHNAFYITKSRSWTRFNSESGPP